MSSDVLLSSGGYDATVTTRGGGLRQLSWGGRDLVLSYPDATPPRFMGAVLAPWPNRIADGIYDFAGRQHQLDVTEPATRSALHGLAHCRDWTVTDRSRSSAELQLTLLGQPGYPWSLQLKTNYRLDDEGLAWSLHATNLADEPAPYGCGIHPYLRAPGPMDGWTLHLPDDELALDARSLDDTRADPLHSTQRSAAVANAGVGAGISWTASTPWLQIYTADHLDTPHARGGVAIEPMTCPPQAFRTGQDLLVLQPGDEHLAAWRIFAIG